MWYNQVITTGLPWENLGNLFFRESEIEVLGSRITEGRVWGFIQKIVWGLCPEQRDF